MIIDNHNLGGLPDWRVIYNAIKATEQRQNALKIMAGKTAIPEPKRRRWPFG